ncbi:MAG: hypothetical protein ACI93T_002649, partial [Porticoccaceae bacterium]
MSNHDETLASDNDEVPEPDDPKKQPDSIVDGNSETVMEPGSDHPRVESVKPEDTVALPADQQGFPDADSADQTFVLPEDQTVVEDTSFGDPGTIADFPTEESADSSAVEADDRTVVEPLSGILPPSQENADDASVASDQPFAERSEGAQSTDNDGDNTQLSMSDDDSDRTSIEDAGDEQGGTVIESVVPDNDATFIEGASTGNADPDGTVIEGSTNQRTDPDGTIIEGSTAKTTDPDGTIIEGATGAGRSSATGATEFESTATGGASSKGNWNETRDSNQKKQSSRKKAAHETSNRWDAEQRYQLVTNFARGGLGQIWMANDGRLRREVAFKELLPNALKNRNALERFLEEAQITGQLEHPSIVPIYDIGYQENGTPFYAMKLVRGETMEKEIETFHQLPKGSPEWTLTFRRLLANFIDICNALAFAHDRGVLHRDLKPLNV